MEEFALRIAERILGVLIGGFAVYLGYRLFIELPIQTDSSGKVILPGGVSIYLSRIGPGVFFALFGAMIVGASLLSKIELVSHESRTTQDTAGNTTAFNKTQEIRGMASGTPGTASEQARMMTEARTQIYTLNVDWVKALRPDLHADDRKILDLAHDYSKQKILRAIWQDRWGSFTTFEQWVNNGATLPPPDELTEPAEIYGAGTS
ncbi:hypothetical protein SAMN05660964_02107 [Thiothrix caldifontis]|uniref:Uncharacterized protein n=1 Tax=Thiothrix caldifontis TaxID=525918 RepID=A0A1H4D129_9GAMM|nr:hypothetical protein [Thiothrix caldifontis]SEA66230.1 hypothetical protein SAMN05660964_02107 [Thiothrix caldifontis]